MEKVAFEQWCLVEIFGHQKYAGLVTEQVIGGCNFVRLDVPATPRTKPFTKLFGQGAIYSMTPIEEDVARSLAESYDQRPVNVYELPADVRSAMHQAESAKRLTSNTGVDDEDEDDSRFGAGDEF